MSILTKLALGSIAAYALFGMKRKAEPAAALASPKPAAPARQTPSKRRAPGRAQGRAQGRRAKSA
jgi:hypothetical protein